MFRKFTLAALPAAALAVTFFASVDSASQAFAKGGSGSHGSNGKMGSGRGRDFHRDDRNRRFDRYFGSYFGWSYPCYDCAACPTCTETVVATAPVVEAPVCTTCEPVVVGFESSGRGYWGYGRHFRGHERDRGSRGHSGHGKR